MTRCKSRIIQKAQLHQKSLRLRILLRSQETELHELTKRLTVRLWQCHMVQSAQRFRVFLEEMPRRGKLLPDINKKCPG